MNMFISAPPLKEHIEFMYKFRGANQPPGTPWILRNPSGVKLNAFVGAVHW
jgi:hypothetical protein